MDLMRRLIERWAEHHLAIRRGASATSIEAFEKRHRVLLPADLREYLSTVDGMDGVGTTDDDLFSFFSLSDFQTIAERAPDRAAKLEDAHRYFIFADHSIALPSFAIRLTEDSKAGCPIASVYTDAGTLEVEDIFDSFTDFVRSYLDDPHGTSVMFPRNVG